MQHPHNPKVFGPTINRLLDVMEHCDRYAFKGSARLALDAGVNRASVSRLISGQINPSFLLVVRLTEALERQLGRRIDPRDVVAESGRFLTPFCCDLANC